jgi:hypothetical protein
MKTPKQAGVSQETATERTTDKTPIDELDKPRTYKDAAIQLSVGYHVVQRAARRGLVRTYRLGTSRPYVKLRDLFDLMERSAKPAMETDSSTSPESKQSGDSKGLMRGPAND